MALITGACDTTDFSRPGIDGDVEVEGGRGTQVNIPLTLRAEAGIESLTVSMSGDVPEDVEVDRGASEQELTYPFDIPAESQLGRMYRLNFVLTDQAGEKSTITAIVTTSALIETPETYEFTRDGESSVFHSGQSDRLDMLEEMTAYMQNGDRGEVLSEQALLEMFENAGGNGGGRFSFTSDKQLKDKTFPTDLDERLFEKLFAGAAAASENGSAGVTASKGTAGLLSRESDASTILVDENGRAFTQLVEIGLMGAVFLHQIYNVHLTDDRIGEPVENFEPVEGKNYTAIEHHWDETFGYFDPPPDFTSPWADARRNELRFWSGSSEVVDDVAGGQLGTNAILMEIYIQGRTAIVNNDPATVGTQRDLLYQYHELVAAAVTVHYINDAARHVDDGNTGDAFHSLSKAWAFMNALRYSPRRTLTLDEIHTIQEEHFGAGGSFWNVTSVGLSSAKATIVRNFPALGFVQNDL